ncbi:MAG TPA: DUF2249 domain-containing protein [Ignavibacteria bacterium]|nr:DUF2249 domain-containing protein [Ignavibacteria bacterium]
MEEIKIITQDIKPTAPKEKHPTIFAASDSLSSDDILQSVNDYNPISSYYQMLFEREDQFEWK